MLFYSSTLCGMSIDGSLIEAEAEGYELENVSRGIELLGCWIRREMRWMNGMERCRQA